MKIHELKCYFSLLLLSRSSLSATFTIHMEISPLKYFRKETNLKRAKRSRGIRSWNIFLKATKLSLLKKNKVIQVYKPICFSTVVSDNSEIESTIAIFTAMHCRKLIREVKLLTFNSCALKVLLLIDRVEPKNTAKPSQQSKTTHKKYNLSISSHLIYKFTKFSKKRPYLNFKKLFYYRKGINTRCLKEINLIFKCEGGILWLSFGCCVVLFILFFFCCCFVYFIEKKSRELTLFSISNKHLEKFAYEI